MSAPVAAPLSASVRLLMRATLFGLSPVENGGAELYPFSPFGGEQPLLARVVALAKLSPTTTVRRPLAPKLAERAASVYLDLLEALPRFLKQAQLAPGRYEIPSVARGLAELTEGRDLEDAVASAVTETAFAAAIADGFAHYRETVEVTETLLAMVRVSDFRLQWNFEPWSPFADAKSRKAAIDELVEFERAAEAAPPGTPFVAPVQSVDGKRPYGPRTYYYWDLEDLGVPGIVAEGPPEHGRAAFTGAQQKAINALQVRTPQVCQVIARHGRMS